MPTRQIATRIVTTLQNAGHIAYFAGGFVRDMLLKHPSDDIDIATSASVEEIQALFPKTIPVGISFGIVIVVEGLHQFEIATFRKESEYIDGRRPHRIEPATPEEDAKRRDFTMNGMFFDPIQEQLLDFVGGVEDLKQKRIRAIGNPEDRFFEDRLRMIRAVRYATRFHFIIDTSTEEAIRKQAHTLFPSVAIERVWQEFQKMSLFASFGRGLAKLYDLHLLQEVFPSLDALSSDEVHERLIPFSSFPKGTPLILELLHLFPNHTLEQNLSLCDQLKLSSKDRESVRFFHKAKQLLSLQPPPENFELAHFYAHPQSTLCLALCKASHDFHNVKQKELSSHILRLQSGSPLIRASDLIHHGILPSPAMGILLQEAERIAMNYLLEDKHIVLERLKHHPLWAKAPRKT